MRVVGGEFRGRALATPRSDAIRPTSDRTREAVFNVIAHRYPDRLEGGRVLDLFDIESRAPMRRWQGLGPREQGAGTKC